MSRSGRIVRMAAVVAVGLIGLAAPAQSIPDPVETVPPLDLVFLMDGSGSIDGADWQLQKDGYAAALKDQTNFPLDGSVAVSVIQWSSNGWDETTRVEVPLTRLTDAASVDQVTDAILGIQQMGNSTNPGDALVAGTDQLLANGRDAGDWVLCMSTDGAWNSGQHPGSAASYASSSGVDKYSVVAIEDPPFFDRLAAESAYGPWVFGGGTVTTARTTAEFTSLVGGCANDAMRVRAVEVNQAIQDWDNSIPLVAAKPTVARAFVETPDGSTARVNGRLRGVRDGVELPGSPLTPLNGENGVEVDGLAMDERSDLDGTLNFALPAAWTTGGVELTLELPGGSICIDETGAEIGCGTWVWFDEPAWEADMSYRWVTWPGGPEFDWAAMDEQHERLMAQLPTSGWRAGFTTLELDDAPERDRDGLEDVNEALNTARELEDSPDGNRWYGILHGVAETGGLASGRVSSGWDDELTDEGDGGYGRNRVVHEVGHTLGMHHAVNADQNGYEEFWGWIDTGKRGWCGEVADTDAPEWPHWVDVGADRRAALGPVGQEQTEVWGLDPRLVLSEPDLAVVEPQATFALMSYCNGVGQSRWIGAPDYEHLLEGDLTPINGGDGASGPGSGLALRGLVSADAATAELRPALAVDRAPQADDPEGTHVLEVLGAGDSVLHQVRFTPQVSDQDTVPGQAVTTAADALFNVVVPADLAGVTGVRLRHGGATALTVQASASTPEVTLDQRPSGTADTVRFSWRATDADGPAPRSTVLYSNDDGASWQVLGVDLSAQELIVDRRTLAGGAAARFRVITSDGLRSSVATSQPFAMPDLAPLVSIGSPGEGTTLLGSQSVMFTASAHDPETGALDGARVTWSSDRDGDLGSGTLLTRRADTLSEGIHTVTVRATDPAGQVSTDTVTITVKRTADPEPPAADVVFDGFTEPAVSAPTANAGSTIPIKWSVSGADAGPDAVTSASFLSDGATYGIVRSATTWHVNAKTPRSWAGTTQVFRVVLADGSIHEIALSFR